MLMSEELASEEEGRDASVTWFESAKDFSRKPRPISLLPRYGGDILTATVVFLGPEFTSIESTSQFITIFPQQIPTVPLDTWVEIDVYFPPKKTRPLMGKLVKGGRAKFQTAFADELIKM